jgi:anaerobic magnesium-protoporphyrin IX monomethyl ester cyclase
MPQDRSRPRRRSDIWLRSELGGVKILSDASLRLDQYELNSTAGIVWSLCDGKHTISDIVDRLASRCDDPPAPPKEHVLADVLRCVENMAADGLLEWSSEPEVDVLLAVPPPPPAYSPLARQAPEYSAPPLGLAYIAAVLRLHGCTVAIVDLQQADLPPEAIIASCRRYHPRLVGITTTTPTYASAVAIARCVKAWRQDCATVLGGPHATCAPAECVLETAVDYVCVGEGERPMAALARAILDGHIQPGSVPGFCIRGPDGRPLFTGSDSSATALDDLPFPARDLLQLDAYHQKGAIVGSRGCPVGCHFCACSAIAGRTYRAHSLPYVVREMEHLLNAHGCRSFDFHDDTFNLLPRRVYEFCDILNARGLGVGWGCFCRVDTFSEDLAQQMARAGCSVVQFGVESGSNRVLRSLGKGISTEQVQAAVIAASRAGIEEIVCGFIVGHPADTEDSVRETIAFGLRLREQGATRLTLSLLTPYPGTPVYENRDRLGVRLLTTDWDQYTFSHVVAETAHLSGEALRQLYAEGVFQFL